MSKIEFEKTGEHISLEEINELEEKMKLRLPNEVKAFYSRQNGGVPIQYRSFR